MPVGILRNVDGSANDTPGDGDSPGKSPVWLIYSTAIAIVGADQAAKFGAFHWLQPAGSIPLTSWLNLTWATNTGGAFGVFETNAGRLAAVAAAVVVGLILIAPHLGSSRLLAFGIAGIMGGAVGNLIDRMRVGYVIDYIDLGFWPVFNIADIAISVGAGLLIIATLLGHPHPASSGEDSD